MTTGVQAWSKTAANNATADSAVNWAEGMAPSAVNDSARAEMASVAKWRDDFNGSITTGGSSTAYTVTTNQTMTALVNSLLAFVPHTTNGATVTLATDSIGAKPLRSAPGVELPAGVLVQGTPYTAVYYTTNSGEWILQGFYGNTFGLQVGMGLSYLGSAAPSSNFALPFGQALNRITYATLFALVGTTFGAGDGSTTFNFLDVRGRVEAGLDNMGGSTAGRITNAGSGIVGTTIGATGGAETVTLTTAQMPSHTHVNSLSDPGHRHSVNNFSGDGTQGSGSPSARSLVDTFTGTQFTGITIINASAGSDGSHTNMPPVIILPKVYRII